MTMPKFSDLFTEVLETLSDGKAYPRRELFPKVVDKLDLTPEERAEKIAGGYFRAQDRVHWACAFLVYAEAIKRPQRGYLQITDLGRRLLADNTNGVNLSALEKTTGLQAWYARTAAAQQAKKGHTTTPTVPHHAVSSEGASPLEQMETAMISLKADVAAELLSRLRTEHWSFMERAVLKILLKLGYGRDEEDLFHVGGPYDGGIDGIINQDKLGLDRIYVQSKRYKEGSGISGATINEFMGAMDRKGVSKGVFLTASHFTPEAKKAVAENNNKQIVLIDGDELTDLMVQYKIGATEVRTFSVFQIDENFFED
jgi:restriction system protein